MDASALNPDSAEQFFKAPVDEDSVQHRVVRQAPWLAIATALHGVALVIAVFIITSVTSEPEIEIFQAYLEEAILPSFPPEKVQPDVEVPQLKPEVAEQVAIPALEDQTDEVTSDPTDQPHVSRALNNSPDDSEAESPNTSKSTSSAIGLGGGQSGGPGKRGDGGSILKPIRTNGSCKPPEHRVEAGLLWLADHQRSEGFWDAANFLDSSVRLRNGATTTGNVEVSIGEPGAGYENSVNVGVTGLALLAFVGDGHTHRDSGPFQGSISRALRWIMTQQNEEGLFGIKEGDEYVYNHAICTMALAELYEMTKDKKIKQVAQRGVDFIISAQNPGAGWRYGVRPGDNDSSVTAWMVLALKSAKMAGLSFPDQAVYADANAWYDKVSTSGDKGYLSTGYHAPGTSSARLEAVMNLYDDTPSMDACCVMVRLFTGHTASSSSQINRLAGNMLAQPPEWTARKLDFYYWYYASLALSQLGDRYWKQWEKHVMHPCLFKYQRGWHPTDIEKFGKGVVTIGADGVHAGAKALDEFGSWDPIDAWGSVGGRVYATAINTLTLESVYRYRDVLHGK